MREVDVSMNLLETVFAALRSKPVLSQDAEGYFRNTHCRLGPAAVIKGIHFIDPQHRHTVPTIPTDQPCHSLKHRHGFVPAPVVTPNPVYKSAA